ncbi:MAG TPA: MarP family serine protease [Candidatus Saccharimonadales bacterium]|nr:MarP family serine protease [Candidatus Saccharimonadales bacterium]
MLVDLLIIVLTLSAFYRGRQIGLIRQLCSTIGFFGGLFLGALVEHHAVAWAQTPTARAALTLLITLGFAIIFLTVGEYIGIFLKRRAQGSPLNRFDNGLGAVLSVGSWLLTIWLLAAMLLTLPFANVETAVRDSHIVTFLNDHLPSAPTVIANLGHLIDPNGFPQVFIGSEPVPRGPVNLPSLGSLLPAVNRDKDSVVKIEGQGCGGVVAGSGFVVGSQFIATNAHVVAGIQHPFVEDVNGTHSSTVVWFDPNLDFAVLRVSNLAGKPLVINTRIAANNSPGAVLGYPGGGAFTAKQAAVMDQFEASGRNIYGQGRSVRSVYELQADIIPGNSGGPLITQNGSVVGVVFAQSTSYSHVGYALTMAAVSNEINQAIARNQTVGTGQCAQ